MIQKNISFACLIFLLTSSLYSDDQRILKEAEQVFTTIYENNWWWTGETHSGCGSNLYSTQLIRQEIPRIIREYNITSFLDIPCGDFHWMQYVDLNIPYIGADIVKDLVINNQKKYQSSERIFMHLDIITDNLPYADLIFCRDCFVHLSYAQIWQSLKNIKKSGAKYLLATSYSNTRINSDIAVGSWRPLNLMVEPFNFSNPMYIFNEGYEGDKCLVLWKLEDINL